MAAGPGYYDEDGVWMIGEADAAPGNSFSELINKVTRSVTAYFKTVKAAVDAAAGRAEQAAAAAEAIGTTTDEAIAGRVDADASQTNVALRQRYAGKPSQGFKATGQDSIEINIFDHAGIIPVEGPNWQDYEASTTALEDLINASDGLVQERLEKGDRVKLSLAQRSVRGDLVVRDSGCVLGGTGRIFGQITLGREDTWIADSGIEGSIMVSPTIDRHGIIVYPVQRGYVRGIKMTAHDEGFSFPPVSFASGQLLKRMDFSDIQMSGGKRLMRAHKAPEAAWNAAADLHIINFMGDFTEEGIHLEGVDGLTLSAVRLFGAGKSPTKGACVQVDVQSDWVTLDEACELFEAGTQAVSLYNAKQINIAAVIGWAGERVNSEAIKLDGTTQSVDEYRTDGVIRPNIRGFSGPAIGFYGDRDYSGVAVLKGSTNERLPISRYYGPGLPATRRRVFVAENVLKAPQIMGGIAGVGDALTDLVQGVERFSQTLYGPRDADTTFSRRLTFPAVAAPGVAAPKVITRVKSLDGKLPWKARMSVEVRQVTANATQDNPFTSTYELLVTYDPTLNPPVSDVKVLAAGGRAPYAGANTAVPTLDFTAEADTFTAVPKGRMSGEFSFFIQARGNFDLVKEVTP